jgi:hypothetical protein
MSENLFERIKRYLGRSRRRSKRRPASVVKGGITVGGSAIEGAQTAAGRGVAPSAENLPRADRASGGSVTVGGSVIGGSKIVVPRNATSSTENLPRAGGARGGGVTITGDSISIGGDLIGGDMILSPPEPDEPAAQPITCLSCGRGYIPADNEYACPNCGAATPDDLLALLS